MVILSTLESNNLDESIKICFKRVHSNPRMLNLEFVNLKCCTYTKPISVPVLYESTLTSVVQSKNAVCAFYKKYQMLPLNVPLPC